MSYTIDLGDPMAGYAMTSARAGETIPVRFREFVSTEDGQHLIEVLEGLPSIVLNRLPRKISPSMVDNLLVICHRDGRVEVYVNELEVKLLVRASRPVNSGDPVLKDDIANIELLDFGVQLPDDAGFLFLFSVGWRKGLYYDLGPLGPEPVPRAYDISHLLGQAYCHVLFQERFRISDSEWTRLFEAKLFPFVGLSDNTISAMINHVRSGWDTNDMTDDMISEVRNRSTEMLDSWRKVTSFEEHICILERAVERFQARDAISCTSLLYSRIEGILRTHLNSLGVEREPSPRNLSETAVAAQMEKQTCLLLPHRFDTYLREVYFADFDPSVRDIKVSRHSVGHGVASVSEYSMKSAALAILIVHQLSYFLGGSLIRTDSKNCNGADHT